MKAEFEGAIILSGEGEQGTFEHHTGKPTLRAINRRLNVERCQGDRWARAYIPAGSGYEDNTYFEIDEHGGIMDLRTIWPEDIKEDR